MKTMAGLLAELASPRVRIVFQHQLDLVEMS